MKRYTTQDYSRMVQTIRPYAKGFGARDGYDLRSIDKWSSGRKAAVTRYYDLVKSFSQKPVYVYRPRSKKALEAINRALGVSDYPRLKVGFIQIPSQGTKPSVKISKRGQVKIKTKTAGRDLILFEDYGISDTDLAVDPLASISDLVEKIGADYKYFTIMAGEFEIGFWEQKSKGIPKFMKPANLVREFMKLIEAYSADNYDANNPSSSYYGNWLRGIVGYTFSDQKNFRSYLDALTVYKNNNEIAKEKIRRAKEQIKKWSKDLNTLSHRRRIDPAEKAKKIKSLNKKVDQKRQLISDLIQSRIKRSTGH